MSSRAERLERLNRAVLYVLVNAQLSEAPWDRWIQSLVTAGVDALQLRDKRLSDRQLLRRARRMRQLTRDTSTLFIVNDRSDVAALAEADGVHLGQDELSPSDARLILGPDPLIGVSTHSLDQARQAVREGADYIGVGPTFPSMTKSFEHFPGLRLLQDVADHIRLPAFAIGGIGEHNMASVLGTGIRRVAISSAVCGCEDPIPAIGRLKKLLASGA